MLDFFCFTGKAIFSRIPGLKKKNDTSNSIGELTQKLAKILSALQVKTKEEKIQFPLDEGFSDNP